MTLKKILILLGWESISRWFGFIEKVKELEVTKEKVKEVKKPEVTKEEVNKLILNIVWDKSTIKNIIDRHGRSHFYIDGTSENPNLLFPIISITTKTKKRNYISFPLKNENFLNKEVEINGINMGKCKISYAPSDEYEYYGEINKKYLFEGLVIKGRVELPDKDIRLDNLKKIIIN